MVYNSTCTRQNATFCSIPQVVMEMVDIESLSSDSDDEEYIPQGMEKKLMVGILIRVHQHCTLYARLDPWRVSWSVLGGEGSSGGSDVSEGEPEENPVSLGKRRSERQAKNAATQQQRTTRSKWEDLYTTHMHSCICTHTWVIGQHCHRTPLGEV